MEVLQHLLDLFSKQDSKCQVTRFARNLTCMAFKTRQILGVLIFLSPPGGGR